MTQLVAGSRARFVARFTSGGEPWDPLRVTATVSTPTGPRVFQAYEGGLQHVSFGVFAVELVLRDVGAYRVVFEADTGEFSDTSYEVVPAESAEVRPAPAAEYSGRRDRHTATEAPVREPEVTEPDLAEPEPDPPSPEISRWVGSVLAGGKSKKADPPWRKS